jgi:DNA-binding transcriptional MerR regulator
VSEELWTVGTLARFVGVSPDSIRHYERIEILPKATRSRAGYRVWRRRDVEYLKWVGPARRAGFTLRELAQVFQMYRAGVAPCHTVGGLLEQKLGELDAEITQLEQLRQELSRVHRVWQKRLGGSSCGEFVHLFDDLHELTPARRPGWLGFGRSPSPARGSS